MRTTAIVAVVFLVAVSTAVCACLTSYLSQRALEQTLRRDARMLTETASRGMADHLEHRELSHLRELIDNMALDQRITFVAVTDDAGKTLVRRIGDPDGWWRYIQRYSAEQLPSLHINQAMVLRDPGRSPLIVHIQPIWETTGDPQHAVLRGYLVTAMEDPVITQMAANLRSAAAAIVCIIALLILPLAVAAVRLWTSPIAAITEQAIRLTDGQSTQPVRTGRRDEIGLLADAFNTMTDRLGHAHHALRRANADLELQVEERTDQLQQAIRQLQAQVLTDPLTQLANRRCIEQSLERAFAEAQRYDSDLACVMIDLDGFKQMNDSLGHQAGDKLLQLAGKVLQANCRRSDVAGRYGGDEFVLLLPRTDPDTALAVAQRIQEQFRSDVQAMLHCHSHATSGGRCGMSVGIACVSRHRPVSADQLVALADAALYLAKAAGKGRIMFHPTPAHGNPQSPASQSLDLYHAPDISI
ncbi:MAG: GGDEF domain-containing protein [Phycisphaerales bacterium]